MRLKIEINKKNKMFFLSNNYQKMKYFLSYKFSGVAWEKLHNDIDPLVKIVKDNNHDIFCNLYHDHHYVSNNYSVKQILTNCFIELDTCDVYMAFVDDCFCDGMAIECGYAYSKNMPIVILVPESRQQCHASLDSLASHRIYYKNHDDLHTQLNEYFKMKEYIEYYIQKNKNRSDQKLSICDMDIFVDKNVFNPDPNITYAPLMVLNKLNTVDLRGKTVLDLGTGTGLLALYCLKNGASYVTCTDIDEDALNNAKENLKNYTNTEVIKSDLFQNLNNKKFDIILYNLPVCESAWNIDIDSMFKTLFKQIKFYMNDGGIALNVFATFGNIHFIRKQLKLNNLTYSETKEVKFNVTWSLFVIE